jgi:heptosyltransferase-1
MPEKPASSLCENECLPKGNQQRVLIVRLGAMGDILHALPAVTALRIAHPELVLGWAVEPHWRALLIADSADEPSATMARNPAKPLVDHVHLIPAKQWGKQPLQLSTLRSILQTRRQIRDAGYDAAMDVQGAVRSAIIARWAGSQRLLGEAVPREPAARWLYREQIPSTGVHVIEQAAHVVEALFQEPLEVGLPWLPFDAEAASWCDQQAVAASAAKQCLLHPGAGWGAKRWPVERYAEVGVALHQQAGIRVLIHAAPAERHLATTLAAAMLQRGVEPLILTPTVGQLIEVSRRVELAIGGDTGPLHLAAALGKATVGIFGPTDPARNGPFHGEHSILRDPQSRRDHSRREDPEAGLLRITPDAVVEAALGVLARVALKVSVPQHANILERNAV